MFDRLRRKIRELRSDQSGNATMLLALGLPVMIGGTGLAVDTAQWYMWKNELQFAVDQAALAAAWTRTSSSAAVQDTYKTRAEQEYNANISMVADFDSFNKDTQVTLAAYGGTTINSVKVNASATHPLPFSYFISGKAMTMYANAQAKYQSGQAFEACMLAIDPHANQAFKFGGSVTGGSTCGAGSLSDDPDAAMKEVGNTSTPLGKLISTGGIDPGFANNGTIYEDQTGLSDPYAGLTTPSSAGAPSRTYECQTKTDGYTTADVTVRTVVNYTYYSYNNSSKTYSLISDYNGDKKQPDTDNKPGVTTQDQVVTTTTDYTDGPTSGGYVKKGNGNDAVYEVATTTKYYSFADIKVIPANDGIARPLPGVYSSINIACPTIFGKGIYFIGDLDFGNNQSVTAKDVMFVMTNNSGNIKINSNTQADLQGITKNTLMTDYSYSEAEANKLKSMLFWDPISNQDFGMEGNANVKIEGAMYMPNRSATFNGNVAVAATGGCMMVASKTMTINGNFNISNFCKPSEYGGGMQIGGGTASVTLVA